MTLEEMFERGIISSISKPSNICPKCSNLMKHGFRINSYQCVNCEYNEETSNISSFKI